MDIGDLLTLIRSNFKLDVDTASLTADRIVTLQDKSGTLALTSDITTGGSTGYQAKQVVAVTASKTIAATDLNNIQRCNNTAAITITIPANTFPIGSEIEVIQGNTGSVTISFPSGTIQKLGGANTSAILIGQYAGCIVTKLETGVWYLSGDVSY